MNQRLSGFSCILIGDTESQTSYSIHNKKIVNILNSLGAEVNSSKEISRVYDADIVIHHEYQNEFSRLRRGAGAKMVAYRTWDFGPYPPRWVEIISDEFDQLWVYSHFTKDMAIRGGVSPSSIRVVPPIFNDQSLNPKGPAYPLRTDAAFKFVFVGAAIYRKGIDVLLSAYRQAFSAKDDVCLVIKDNPGDVFYQNLHYTEEISQMLIDPRAPELIHINEFLSRDELAQLYRACDVGVFPYRAEGYAIPIVELMACGKPSIAPDFGPSKDYADQDNSFVIPARKIDLAVNRQLPFNTLGFSEELERVYFCEVDPEELAEKMREIYHLSRSEIAQKGVRGTQFFTENLSLERLAETVASGLEDLITEG